MTEAHLNNLIGAMRDAARLTLAVADDSSTDLPNETRRALVRAATGVQEAQKAFKDLWNERDEADRSAGAAARKIHQLQRQLDKLHEKKASAKKRRPWPRRAT